MTWLPTLPQVPVGYAAKDGREGWLAKWAHAVALGMSAPSSIVTVSLPTDWCAAAWFVASPRGLIVERWKHIA